MIRALRLLVLCAAIGAAMLPVSAQEVVDKPAAVLVADSVAVSADRVLTAKGNVEVFQGDVSLTATSITYDPRSETLSLEGPIVMRDGEDVVILAEVAELDRDLQNGILKSARLVLQQQVQLAAGQINRVNGRYSQLYKAAATSCKICEDGKPPLWQIRAKRIVHDQEERQIYFDDAQFRIRGMPVFYIPRLRLPDPTLERATGFLIPTIRTTSQLGTGLKVPYFFRLGAHRDLTLTPYLSAKTRTLEWRYRQAFRSGRITFDGAYTRDSLISGEERSYIIGEGAFNLPLDFKLNFDVELTRDDAYLKQYGYSDKDRLDSEIAISRTRRDEYIRAGLIHFNSLRAGESNATLPTIVVDGTYDRRLFPAALGGEFRLNLEAHSHTRTSSSSVSGQGRDVTRVHGDVHWLRNWAVGGGLRAESTIGLAFDAFDTRQDAVFSGTEADVVPQAAVALRYPLSKTSRSGAVHFLEPLVQLSWTGGDQAPVANDESTQVEFDEGNLLALSRFPEKDRREHGAAVAVGVNWARYDPSGWESYVSLGHIVRETSNLEFSRTSGLGGKSSDFLVAAQVRNTGGLAVGGRFVFDERFSFAKAELRGDWSTQAVTLGGSYVWLVKDAAENRPKNVSEFTLDGAFKLSNHWTMSANWRYDVEDDRTARAGVGFGYFNECVAVDLAVNRRFGSSTSVEPSTSFGLTMSLRGFSAQNGTERYTRSCS